MPTACWETLTGSENLLILAPRPGDESRHCGGLIAQCCRRGRPPFVVVLTDGVSAADRSHEADIRAATRALGLPAGRLLIAGLFCDALPAEGPAFDAIVHGLTMIMWARDCNVVCAPWAAGEHGDVATTQRIAEAVVRRSGVGRLYYLTTDGAAADPWCLDIAAELAAKRRAVAVHDAAAVDPAPFECFVSPAVV